MNGENKINVESIIKGQKKFSGLVRNLTIFLTNGNLSDKTPIEKYQNMNLLDLLKDKKLNAFSQLIDNSHETITLGGFINTFRKDCGEIFEDKEFKKRYTKQLVIGMARLEGIPDNIIEKIYGEDIIIDEEMQNIFKINNLTFMDLTSCDVSFEEKEKELFVYTMLFLHDGENKNIDKANESGYYKVSGGGVEIKEYGIKSFEQAFNCGFQIYNEFFGNNKDKEIIFHYPINSIDDIYALYDNTETLIYNGKIIDSHTLAGILNITRALLHVQAHKHLDYIRGEIHDPASFIKYKKGQHWKYIYGPQIDEVRDWEIESLWRNEISTLEMKDKNGKKIKERSTKFYSADTKSWYLQDVFFNDVETSFSGRSKGLTSWVMKLVNDPKYKKGKDVTDSLGNSFYVKNKEDGLKVWLGLIEKLPERLVDGARFDIKGSQSWNILIDKISKNGELLQKSIIYNNLKDYNISNEKIDLLLRNRSFRINLNERLRNINELKNTKTVQGYEEFKLVTTNGTEYQISEKSDDMITSYNEFGLGNHGIYNIKKLMELLLRPDNHTIVLGHDIIENIINNALDEEEFYIKQKAYKMGIINDDNSNNFNPRNAISNQLLYDDMVNNTSLDSTIINQIKDQRNDFFSGKKEKSRELVKEFIYNMINKEYIGYLTKDKTYKLSKPLGNQRSTISQLLGYKIYKKNSIEESSI